MMTKFIKNLFLFLSPIFILGISMELLLRRIPNDYRFKKNYLDQNSNKLDVLFLGSSHAYYGIIPEEMTLNSFNAAYISQSLDYDLEIFNKYFQHPSSLKIVVVSISYFSLFSNIRSGVESWRSKNYNIYYGINLDCGLTDYMEIFSSKNNLNIGRIYRYYLKGKSDLSCDSLGSKTEYNYTSQNLDSSGAVAAKRHTVTGKRRLNNTPILEKLIKSAKSRHIKILFYTPPAFKTYVANLNNIQLCHMLRTMKKLDAENENVRYVDLLSDPSFLMGDFFDADHLNKSGAKKLSRQLNGIINQM